MTTQSDIDTAGLGAAPRPGTGIDIGAPAGGAPETEPVALARRRRSSAWRTFFRKPSTLVFGILLVVIALISFLGPFFVGDPVTTSQTVLAPPSAEYPLGTDMLGRDYLARVVYGGQISLLVGFSVALLCMTFGLLVGGLAGYYGGFADTALVKVAEFFQVLPGLVLALVAAALLGSSVLIIVVILAITMWPAVGRIARAEAMRISQLGYVESAKAAGFRGPRIIWSDVIPNAMPPVLVATSMTVGRAILVESGLAYLGVGDSNRPSWGALLNSAQAYMQSGWWLALFPGALIFLTVLAINILGDGLNDAFNPTVGRVK
ncbi:ABC transporter permease [Microbacterium elymi]|uniref:ABC transporter permease n=1 Tax=Microbacterium elymi TaxID=2909587 RepID=A0ABY5NLZ9_9MICO|nr:ABC transporter permease [Microbacterium elymi]UUT36208.1 ABC transporter permease [Microbacterium elymi]